MSEATGRSPVEVFAELQQAFAAGDPNGIAAVLHPDFEIEQPASFPHGGRHRGLAGMGEMGRRFAEHWDRQIADPVVHACGDDLVVQVTTQTWTSKATGRSATVDVVELVTVAGDRIREIRVFQQDTHALLATLGEV
jgi:ketosteroid isomerase-like protein